MTRAKYSVDKSGQPLADTPITLDPPSGPLTDDDWPAEFRTDGVGELRFDGFTARSHTVTVNGTRYPFTVPAYAGPAQPIDVKITGR